MGGVDGLEEFVDNITHCGQVATKPLLDAMAGRYFVDRRMFRTSSVASVDDSWPLQSTLGHDPK
jgi:hypothetical protein